MSKISKVAKANREVEVKKPVVNFMGGISYELNPLDTLKMISASSIFGEPQYYRNSGMKDGRYHLDAYVKKYVLFDIPEKITASELMIDSINKALDYDFKATIEWAAELRNDYYMRLNPQVIMVLAAVHPNRKKFSDENPGLFREINLKVMHRADEPASQLSFYLYNNGSKSNLPSILKRSWCDKIEKMTAYDMAKYKNHEVGLINTIRVCHAKGSLVNELMTTGTIDIDDDKKTWENLRSEGKTWSEIINTIRIPHMALLRNLRNIFSEIDDEKTRDMILDNLKSGVLKGKQFPFRYYSALKAIKNDYKVNFKPQIIDCLEECIDISIANMPKLKGKTICLSDNSGSAWGSFNSEYGSVTIAEIDNLSSVITAMSSDEGYVGKFGDKLKIVPISKRNGALLQANEVTRGRDGNVGGGTENGIWLFFEQAIREKVHYDNIFIYSDMQAGHAGLYGLGSSYVVDGENFAAEKGYHKYIDVMKLIAKYRSVVNPKVNVFCIQTAGYNNTLIPEYTYRGAVLYGWTGKEPLFASKIIEQWDQIENK